MWYMSDSLKGVLQWAVLEALRVKLKLYGDIHGYWMGLWDVGQGELQSPCRASPRGKACMLS